MRRGGSFVYSSLESYAARKLETPRTSFFKKYSKKKKLEKEKKKKKKEEKKKKRKNSLPPSSPLLSFHQKTSPLFGLGEQERQISEYLRSVKEERLPTKMMCVLTGPCGVGKTALAHWLCEKKYGYKAVELNASSDRTQQKLMDLLKTTILSNPLSIPGRSRRSKAFILDEVEPRSSGASTVLSTLERFLSEFQEVRDKGPILCISNNPTTFRCLGTRRVAHVRFPRLGPYSIRAIIEEECPELGEDEQKALVFEAGGDGRQARHLAKWEKEKLLENGTKKKRRRKKQVCTQKDPNLNFYTAVQTYFTTPFEWRNFAAAVDLLKFSDSISGALVFHNYLEWGCRDCEFISDYDVLKHSQYVNGSRDMNSVTNAEEIPELFLALSCRSETAGENLTDEKKIKGFSNRFLSFGKTKNGKNITTTDDEIKTFFPKNSRFL